VKFSFSFEQKSADVNFILPVITNTNICHKRQFVLRILQIHVKTDST